MILMLFFKKIFFLNNKKKNKIDILIKISNIIFIQNGIKIILFDLIILNESIIPPIIEKGNKINILINIKIEFSDIK